MKPLAGAVAVATSVAQARVDVELGQLLAPGSEYRTAVLLLSYVTPDGETHIAHGTGLQQLNVECAYDLLQMVKALRQVADSLDAQIQGRADIAFVPVRSKGSA